MSLASDAPFAASDAPSAAPLAPLPDRLPPVERRAVVPTGFRAGGGRAGIKPSGRPDLAVVATTGGPAAAAGIFTRNAFAAAPVRLTRTNLASTAPEGGGGWGRAVAVISTSGSANAATGEAGDVDQAAIVASCAVALGTEARLVLAMSTGVIGTRLPVKRATAGFRTLLGAGLGSSPSHLEAAARALMTTDSRPKWAVTSVPVAGTGGGAETVTVAGIAKGVGMIHPGMATMLAILLTDARVEPPVLHGLLRVAATRTWNQLTIDGDTSTNDTVIALASGAAPADPAVPGSPAADALGRAIEAVARDLARQQAADGEGATTLLVCQVSAGADDADARAVARAVVASSLVKAAVHGRDPNWGRIAGAAGNARLPDATVLEAAGLPPVEARSRAGAAARLDPDRLRIAIAGSLVYGGGPVAFDATAARVAMDAPEVLVRLDLGLGNGIGEAFGCDLTEAYVRENAEYTT